MNNENNSLVKCGNIVKSKYGDNLIGTFRGKPLWVVFENDYYEKDIKREFPNKHYKSKHMVPRYIIHKNRRPAGHMFLRETAKNKKYLFCLLKNNYKKYFIFDLNKDFSIKENSYIFFDVRGDFNNDE